MAFWKESLEKFRLPGFKPWPVRYCCSALTSFQASELVIKLVHNIPRKDYCDDFLCIYFFILQLKYMKFIYLSFQENNNKYYTRSKNTCVTESTKKTTTQPRWFQFSLFTKPNQGRPMQGNESGQRSVTDFPLLLNSKWPNVSRLALITRKTHDTAHDNRNCDRLFHSQREHWAIKQGRQIWGVIVNSNTSGI